MPNRPVTRLAFTLSQLGAVASAIFADLLRPFGLTPSEAGVLRLISQLPDISQRELADRLGTVPSRVVVLVDRLEQRSLVQRSRSLTDRRNTELSLTPGGVSLLLRLRTVGRAQEDAMVGELSDAEREQLAELLAKVAASLTLDPQVHPGYRPQTPGRD